jgi:hypothetical protein
MGFMDEEEKAKKEEFEANKKEQAEVIRAAVAAAIVPLQREIISLKGEVKELKKVTEKQHTAVIDDSTRREIRGMMASAAEGINSYRLPVYALFGITIIFAGSILWNSHRLNDFAENMDWKYDVVTGVLSGDRHYWWNGENYEASRKAPEAKRLQEALDHYQKINEQLKKQANK